MNWPVTVPVSELTGIFLASALFFFFVPLPSNFCIKDNDQSWHLYLTNPEISILISYWVCPFPCSTTICLLKAYFYDILTVVPQDLVGTHQRWECPTMWDKSFHFREALIIRKTFGILSWTLGPMIFVHSATWCFTKCALRTTFFRVPWGSCGIELPDPPPHRPIWLAAGGYGTLLPALRSLLRLPVDMCVWRSELWSRRN